MIHHFLETIELGFWDIAIPVMTHSKTLRKIVQVGYKVIHDKETKRVIAMSVAVSCTGFGAGILAYSLSILLF